MDGEKCQQNQSLLERRSGLEVSLGQKRGIMDVEETSDSSQKRVKIRDLESVFRAEERGGANTANPDVNSDSKTLDLNVDVGSAGTVASSDAQMLIDKSNNLPTTEIANVQCHGGAKKPKGLDVDLNVEDMSSSINDPFYPYKNYENLKPMDELDCRSSVGFLGENDSMRAWKGLKQNNYMSTSYGGLPLPLPKPRGRKKSNNDAMKRKIELAKKEQVDRFARVASPSGLLNGLNPGIINHVRNSKQVHSIIEALVRSERTENQLLGSKKGNQIKNSFQEPAERKEQGIAHISGVNTSGISRGDAATGRQQMTSDYTFFSKSTYTNEVIRGYNDPHKGQMKTLSRTLSKCNTGHEDDSLALKLSSSVTAASDNTGCLSNDESADLGSVTSLSVKAASIASQWLELLNQDIRGRLAALRRSKKRVRAVVTTELPLLLSREFSLCSNKDSCTEKGSKFCHHDQSAAHAHSVRWSTLFIQMDKALSEEESHLENWLKQVTEMQSHCDKGLYLNGFCHSLQTGPNRSNSKLSMTDESAKDLAVRAAAASIYSTCNLLMSTENLPCC